MNYWRVPLDIQNVKVPKGDIHIIVERCKGCKFCVEYCPKDVLEMSTDFNRKGYHYPQVLKQGACVNCNLCEMICPEFSIYCVEGSTQPPQPEDVLRQGDKHES